MDIVRITDQNDLPTAVERFEPCVWVYAAFAALGGGKVGSNVDAGQRITGQYPTLSGKSSGCVLDQAYPTFCQSNCYSNSLCPRLHKKILLQQSGAQMWLAIAPVTSGGDRLSGYACDLSWRILAIVYRSFLICKGRDCCCLAAPSPVDKFVKMLHYVVRNQNTAWDILLWGQIFIFMALLAYKVPWYLH
jgi:hypothetical protein